MTEKDIKALKEWDLILRNISDFVVVERIGGLKFIIRTDENSGHHKPHLHVESADMSMSVAIEDAEILASSGKISPPQRKTAQKWILEHKDMLKKYWNKFSNGIEIAV